MCLQERHGRLHLLHRVREWPDGRVIEERAYDLGLDAASCRVVHERGEGSEFWAYVDDGAHLHYVSVWLRHKSKRLMASRTHTRKLHILPPYFARAGDRIFCRGTRVLHADAGSFELVPRTRFAFDAHRVYAFTITDGLASLPHGSQALHFLPACEYFATNEGFYRQSGWTNRIERVDREEELAMHERNAVLRAVLWDGQEAASDVELLARSELLDAVRTVGDLFRLLTPGATASWNTRGDTSR